jgi:hypothetical protein
MSSTILTQPNVRVNGAAKTTGPDIPPLHATDSEWDDKDLLSIQTIDPWGVVSVNVNWHKTNPTVRMRLRQEGEKLGVLVNIGNRPPDLRFVPAKDCNLVIFCSPKDLQFAFGDHDFIEGVEMRKLRQHNAITSQHGYGVRIIDLFGLSGRKSLETMAATWGILMDHKSDLDDYKKQGRMGEALLEMPETFLRYSVDDVRVLPKLYAAVLNGIQGIEADLGIPENQRMSSFTLPSTLGATVAKIFRKWLFVQAGEYAKALRFSIYKLGILDQDHTDHEANRQHFHQVCAEFTQPEDLAGKRFPFRADHFRFSALECAGVRYFANRDPDETEIFNSLVHGGRCVNEQPHKLLFGPGLNPDNSSCYPTSMEALTYPVGLPTTWSYPANRKKSPTLGHFLQENGEQLEPHLYTITVQGKLPYFQDLLFSKLAKAENIRRALTPNDDGDTNDIDADMVLSRKELHNAILTHDLLTTMHAVATNWEWHEFLKVKVLTAMAYKKCDRLDNAEAWCRHIMADQGGFDTQTTKAGVRAVDQRSRAWFGVPLTGFISKLKADRERLKKVANDPAQTDEERQRAGGMQNFIKLLLNTFYGVEASRHFPISNVLIANITTARARMGMWQMAKALRTAQSITDGGIYEPSFVADIGRKRPGLESLALMHERPNRDSIHVVPLAGIEDWPQRIAEGRVPSNVDELAQTHVNTFWNHYGLIYPYRIEHDRKDDFLKAATAFGKADYTLVLTSGEPRYKLRGKDKKHKDDPKFRIHDELLAGGDRFPTGEQMLSCRKGLLTFKQWLRFQKCKDREKYKDLMPGDNYSTSPQPARFNNLWIPCDTIGQYRRRARRGQRTREYDLLYERYADNDAGKGIRYVHQKMLQDVLGR